MKKTFILTEDKFHNLLREAVLKTLKQRLEEGYGGDFPEEYDDFGAHSIGDEEDSYTNDLLKGMDVFDTNNNNGAVYNPNDDPSFKDEGGEEDDEEMAYLGDENGEGNDDDDSLYKDALDALEMSEGKTTFEEWYQGWVDEVSQEEAKAAFEKAKSEFKTNEYETDEIPDFSRRQVAVEPEPEHRAGSVIDYDGVEITDDGKQYTMIANLRNPEIEIKGSSLNDVKKTYERLWSDVGSMEEKARKMGMTIWHGAMLWDKDYDAFVRAAGAHEENLPILIDLDKLAEKNNATKPSTQQIDGAPSWLEPYKHSNGKYMLTNYQLSKLTPEQMLQWEMLKKKNPAIYTSYSEVPSEKKSNRSKF